MLTRWDFKDGGIYPSFGISKIEQMLRIHNRNNREDHEQAIKAARNYAKYMATPIKENDWAIAGGIAQGIAGIGAGIAAAANTQIKNMEIRQMNIQRASVANQITQLADQAEKQGVTYQSSEKPEEWGISIDESTAELFKHLKIGYKFSKRPLTSDNNKNKYDARTQKQDITTVSRVSSRPCTISFTCDTPYFIDGYVSAVLLDDNNRNIWREIIPIALWDSDSKTTSLDIRMPAAVSSIRFDPLVLWKIAYTNDPKYHHATNYESSVFDDEERKQFKAEWNRNYGQHEKAREDLKKQRKKFPLIVRLICLAIGLVFFGLLAKVSIILALIFGAVVAFLPPIFILEQ